MWTEILHTMLVGSLGDLVQVLGRHSATQLFPSSDLAQDLFVHHNFAAWGVPAFPTLWPWGVKEIAEHVWGGPSDLGHLLCHRSRNRLN